MRTDLMKHNTNTMTITNEIRQIITLIDEKLLLFDWVIVDLIFVLFCLVLLLLLLFFLPLSGLNIIGYEDVKRIG